MEQEILKLAKQASRGNVNAYGSLITHYQDYLYRMAFLHVKNEAAALDVVSTEPIRKDNVLLKAKNCIITPHISWATKEARERIMQTTAENIKSVIDGAPQNVVNK